MSKPSSKNAAAISVSVMLKELSAANGLVEAQENVGVPRDAVVESLFTTWSSRLGKIGKITDTERTFITQALEKGPWTESQKQELAKLVLTSDRPSTIKRRANQRCTLFENFMPEELFVKIRSPQAYAQLCRANMLALLCPSLGITNPDPPLLYKIVQIIAWGERTYNFHQDNVYFLMDKVQEYIKKSTNTGLPYIVEYPSSAQELPEALKKSAYPDGKLPPTVDIPELATMLGSNKLRGREKTTSNLDWLESVPEALRENVKKQYMELSASNISSGGSSVTWAQLPPNSSQINSSGSAMSGAFPLAHVDPPTTQPKKSEEPPQAVEPEKDAEPKEGTLAYMEQQILGQGKAGGKDNVNGKKHVKVDGKKHVDVSDVFAKLKECKSLQKAQFVNRAYMNAQHRMLSSGASAAEAKEFAQTQRSKAEDLFFELHPVAKAKPKAKAQAKPKASAAKAKAKAKGKVKKTVTTSKHDAAVSNKVCLKFLWKAMGNYSYRNSFVSAASHRTKKLAAKLGIHAKRIKEMASVKAAEAGRRWDACH